MLVFTDIAIGYVTFTIVHIYLVFFEVGGTFHHLAGIKFFYTSGKSARMQIFFQTGTFHQLAGTFGKE